MGLETQNPWDKDFPVPKIIPETKHQLLGRTS